MGRYLTEYYRKFRSGECRILKDHELHEAIAEAAAAIRTGGITDV